MFGWAVGLLTEYATGVDFPHQLALMASYLGIADFDWGGWVVCACRRTILKKQLQWACAIPDRTRFVSNEPRGILRFHFAYWQGSEELPCTSNTMRPPQLTRTWPNSCTWAVDIQTRRWSSFISVGLARSPVL